MQISDVLTPERTLCDVLISSKKRTLELLGEVVAGELKTLSVHAVSDALFARERLGSTGLGHGVAIPHARMEQITEATGIFLRANDGVDFDSLDGKPVDLIFGLLVPSNSTDEHLQILASLAEVFGNKDTCAQLRGASGSAEAYAVLTRVSSNS